MGIYWFNTCYRFNTCYWFNTCYTVMNIWVYEGVVIS